MGKFHIGHQYTSKQLGTVGRMAAHAGYLVRIGALPDNVSVEGRVKPRRPRREAGTDA